MELRRGAETVLVVDDEAMVKDLARDILKRYGYTVLTASGGEEALSVYQQRGNEIAVVVLDVVMPGMDGREVFARIRDINASAKVIVSSGYSNDQEAEEMIKRGAAAFVQKPYRMAELVKAVGEVIEKREGERLGR
jgi:DNA-binding NtrC family response regulator